MAGEAASGAAGPRGEAVTLGRARVPGASQPPAPAAHGGNSGRRGGVGPALGAAGVTGAAASAAARPLQRHPGAGPLGGARGGLCAARPGRSAAGNGLTRL